MANTTFFNLQPALVLKESIITGAGAPGGAARIGDGHIFLFAGNFAPGGTVDANGATLAIADYGSLYNQIGTAWGGNGTTTFAIPDLGLKLAVNAGTAAFGTYTFGQSFGSDIGVITEANIPVSFGGAGAPVENEQASLTIRYMINVTGNQSGPEGYGGLDAIGMIFPYVGTSEPNGQMEADGRLLAIADYPGLFATISTTYGGDGITTFALPDLRGRSPVGTGLGPGLQQITLGQQVGEAEFTLNGTSLLAGGYNQANRGPGLGLTMLVAMEGIYPSRNSNTFSDPDLLIYPIIGQVVIFAGNFVPSGFAPASGAYISINQNTALFSLLGTTFGGDGQTTFALPDLRGRSIIHDGANEYVGNVTGGLDSPLSLGNIPGRAQEGTDLTGGDNADQFTAPAGNTAGVRFLGMGGVDILTGGNGPDTLNGGTGFDTINGGNGNDIAVFTGNHTAYTTGGTAANMSITGPDGIDTLTGIEIFRFADGAFKWSPTGLVPYSANRRLDFDGDNVNDLLFRHASNGTVQAYNGSGGLQSIIGIRTVVAVGDLNGDGTDDVVVRMAGGVLLGLDGANGEAIWSIFDLSSPASDWSAIAIADFNGDGSQDLLLRRASDGMTQMFNGNDGLVQATVGITPAGSGVGVGDVNGDGKDDMIVHLGNGSARAYSGGDGQLITVYGIYTGWTLRAVADFDGDGGDDLLWQRNSDGLTRILNGDGGLQLGLGVRPVGGILAVSDLNADGKADFVVQTAGGTVRTYSGADGSELANHGNFTGWTLRAAGDFDGDGGNDLLWQRNSDGFTRVQNGDGGFQSSFGIQSLGGILGVSDYNNDGAADILVRTAGGAVRSFSGTDASLVTNHGVFPAGEFIGGLPTLLDTGVLGSSVF